MLTHPKMQTNTNTDWPIEKKITLKLFNHHKNEEREKRVK